MKLYRLIVIYKILSINIFTNSKWPPYAFTIVLNLFSTEVHTFFPIRHRLHSKLNHIIIKASFRSWCTWVSDMSNAILDYVLYCKSMGLISQLNWGQMSLALCIKLDVCIGTLSWVETQWWIFTNPNYKGLIAIKLK